MKNEHENLQENFSSWNGQLNEKDELILVDDFSSDASFDLGTNLIEGCPNGQIIKCTYDRPGKKQALIDGVNIASKKYVLLTDADCKPQKQWKSIMLRFLRPGKTVFVLGYAPFIKKKGFLNLFQRYEGILTGLQYISYAVAGLPYMGVGRNLLFKKAIFDPSIYDDNIASGDDDLLVSAFATKENTEVCLDKDSFVYSEAPATAKKYWQQKLRHISSSSKYKFKVKALLSLFSSTQILTYILLGIILLTPIWILGLSLFLTRLFIVTLVLRYTGTLLDDEEVFKMTPILDLCLTFYYLILAFTYPFSKKTKWT